MMAVDVNENLPTYKIVLLGEVDAGKTTLFYHIKERRFVSSERYGPGVDYCSKKITVGNDTVKLVLWDTAGVERFRTLTRNYFRGACAVIFAYNTTNKESLLNLVQFVEDTDDCAPNALRYLVGCKCDMPPDKRLSVDDAKKFAEAHNCQKLFMTSAKTGYGVEEAITEIAKEIHTFQKRKRTRISESDDNPIITHRGFYSASAAEGRIDPCAC